MFKLPPLHEAVLHDRCKDYKTLVRDPKHLQSKDRLGFTAVEIAQLLDKEKCLELLFPTQSPRLIKITLKGYTRVLTLNHQQFFATFNAHYRSHLHFLDYKTLQEVVDNCPWILRSSFGNEQRQIGGQFLPQIWQGTVADVSIKWVDDQIGYGLFADADLEEGMFIGSYTGLVRRLYRKHSDPNGYCLHYPTRWWSWKYFVIDALKEGNELRFINHGFNPNVKPLCFDDRGLLHHLFLTNKNIKKGEQLLFNYGQDYWQRRTMQELFT